MFGLNKWQGTKSRFGVGGWQFVWVAMLAILSAYSVL